ncbi:MAG: histidine kinase [Verrucomicrobia bacterium]|jgi:ligand-binding sensor domain-containing protein/signal transduction histidine kinase|nr:histidine kinase [Verrucomicrobiota bacterium]
MPNNRWISVTTLRACLLLVFTASAAGVNGNFTIKSWDNEDGLPQSSVIALAQTRDGYLWLGTLGGMARFDGRRFGVFDGFNTPGLGSGRIVFLFADSQGNLWVGTETAGAMLIKDGKIIPLEIGNRSRAGRLVSACEQTNGTVWLCTANGQLCRYAGGSVAMWQLRTNATFIGEYRSVTAEAGGALWVGAQGRLSALELAAIQPGKRLPPEREYAVVNLDLLLASSRGGFWLLANGRVQKFRANQIERDFGLYPWSDAPVFAACEDLQGNLIVGTQNRGVTWFDADGRAERLTTANGLSHATALSLHPDREGNLWVGTDGGGLNRVTRQVFAVPPESNGKVIQSVTGDGENGVWFAIDQEPLRHWQEGVLHEFGKAQGLLNLNVRAVFTDRRKTVWVGTEANGLLQLENEMLRPASGWDTLPVAVSAIYEDRSGVLWVGTRGGLARREGGRWTLFTKRDGLSSDDVRAIAGDASTNLWIGTVGGGLNRLREGKFTAFRQTDGLPSDDVSAVHVDGEGAVWAGTLGSGLARLQDGKWVTYSTRDGLAGNGIGFLIEDGEDNLWIGSNAGLMRVAKKELNQVAHGQSPFVRCRTFGKLDGLPTRECSLGGQPAACRTADGKLWFSTIKGLVSVNPAHLARNTNQPPVMIESVLVDDVLQNTNRLRSNWPKTVTIPPGKERLEIRYTSLNLAAPDRARFKYQLEGHEKKLADAGDTRVVQYPNLPPGQYRFRVIACNEDGVWNTEGATLSVIVEPPFWRTWWFRSVAAACCLGIIIATVHFISTRKFQRQLATLRQLEAVEKERARIARDLHDQLGANLTQVSLLGEMVETDKDQPDEVEAHAKQISATARETTTALDEIVWAANPANDTLDGLVTYACKYAQEYLAVAGLSYRLEAPGKLPVVSIPPDVRHNVFLAFKESVNNAVKHAQATAMKVRVRLESDHFTFEIEDNGRGVTEADKAKGRNGLRNMSRRMKDVGGGFSLGPGAERGTLIRLTVPLRRLAS